MKVKMQWEEPDAKKGATTYFFRQKKILTAHHQT